MVPEQRAVAVPVILPSGLVIFASAFDHWEQVLLPSLSHPVPISRVGGTGLPSGPVCAGRNFATPTTPHAPAPPEHRTAPWPVSVPSGDLASMSTFAQWLHVPPSDPQ